jgi:phosphatidylglycerol---prolipoprotein diacylglyceryl transferase
VMPTTATSAIAASWFLDNLDPGVVWATALVVGFGHALLTAKREGLNPRELYWAGVLGIVFGLWGGHLLGFVYYGSDGRPWGWLRFWSGGQAQYGNLIGGGLALALYLKVRKLPLLTYFDAIAPALALGVSIGRIACFLNGDDYGTLSRLPWAVQFAGGTEAYADHLARGWIRSTHALSLSVHPVQLYATLVWLGFFAILAAYRPGQPGLRLALFAVLQGVGRFVEQIFRGDFRPFLGPLSLTQLISLALVAGGIGIWLYQRKTRIVEPVSRLYCNGQVACPDSGNEWSEYNPIRP